MSRNKNKKQMKANKSKRQTRLIWGMLIVLLVVVFGSVVFSQREGDDTRQEVVGLLPPTISVVQAAELQDAGAFVLDVRQPEEWVDHHAPNTTLIPLDQLESRLDEVPKDREIVVICRSGNRSQTGRDILKSAGYQNVTSMAGGLVQWRVEGYPLISGP